MKIALINEASQASKNDLLYSILCDALNPLGHQVFNYGMNSFEDAHAISYVHVGLLAATLLNSKAVDFVITGCGTGQGILISCNSYPGVQCGFIADPVDAYLFSQINNGNAVSLAFAKGFGWASEINLKNTIVNLFTNTPGQGYPPEQKQEQQYYKTMLDTAKTVTHASFEDILKNLDHELLKTTFQLKHFEELFFANAKDPKISEAIREILNSCK